MTSRRQLFSGLVLLLPSKFRGSWFLGAAPFDRRITYCTANLVTGNLNSLFIPSSIPVTNRLKNSVLPAQELSRRDLPLKGFD
jgi:hypothetical protein